MHTGDLAQMDDEGYLKIVGRIKDMVIRGGENVYPREIEEFLMGHPDIADVQVVGVPDPRYGEELMAWIVTRGGAELDRDAVAEFCQGKIAHYKVPRYVQVVSEFPMTVTGKVQKFKLREQAIEELGLARSGDCLGVCGRYTLSTVDGPEIAQRFSLITPPDEETLGRFNVCPTETIAAVAASRARRPRCRGACGRSATSKFAPINVRSETAATALQVADDRRALPGARRRLVRVAEGRKRKGAPRLPFRYTVDGGAPFAFAGPLRRHRRGDPDHRGQRDLRARPRPDAGRPRGPEAEAAWLSERRRRRGGARVPACRSRARGCR